jgi:hypothetical protein
VGTKRGSALEHGRNEGKHRILVEVPTKKAGLLRGRRFELPAALRPRHVDASVAQLLEMLVSVSGGENMIGALPALKAVPHERQQGVVLLVWRTEKGADMP